jgi:hypothetical protein
MQRGSLSSRSLTGWPIQKFYLRNGLGTQPDAFLHLLGGEFVAPPRLVRVRQIHEGHR